MASIKTARQRHAADETVIATAGNLYRQDSDEAIRGLALFDEERTNIEAGQTWAAEQVGSDESVAELCISYPGTAARLLHTRTCGLDSSLPNQFETPFSLLRRIHESP